MTDFPDGGFPDSEPTASIPADDRFGNEAEPVPTSTGEAADASDEKARSDVMPVSAEPEIDLAGIEADLDGVQAALTRLADGSYWTDEVTGEPIPAAVLATDVLARRS